MLYIPNLLTLLRVAAAPVLIVVLEERAYNLALLVFIFAGASDGLDGYIAKRYRCETRLGAILDPVADKVLLVSAFVMLTFLDLLPLWLLVTVVFRDVLIVGGYLVLVILDGTVHMRPSLASKLNTLLQILLVAVVLAQHADWLPLASMIDPLTLLVFATTVVSGAHYVWVWAFGRHSNIRQSETSESVSAKPEADSG
jgi:cardiolipin synthase